MPSTYTSSLRLVLPATGELSNTWGTVFNAGATSLIDTSIAGTASVTMTAAESRELLAAYDNGLGGYTYLE